MNWATVLWTMTGSAFLTLGAFHALLAVRQRSRVDLLFSLTAISGAAMTACEIALMRSATAEQYGSLLRWIHVPIFLLAISLVLFVRDYFGAGRRWLAVAAITTRAAALLVNFLHSPNLNFVEMTGPRRVSFLGEEVSAAQGVVSSWTRLGEFASVLLLIFLCDATITVWRRGDTRRGIIGIGLIVFVASSVGVTSLIHAGALAWPYMLSFGSLGVVAAMTFDLTSNVLQANELSRALRKSESDLIEREGQLAMASALPDLAFWSWDVARDEVWMTQNGRALRGDDPEAKLGFARLLAPIHPEDREMFERDVRGSLETGLGFHREYRLEDAQGGIRWISAIGRAEAIATGRSPRVHAVLIDVTARKLAELEVARQRNELAHLSRVSTLGQLSGSLAHELNQPLAAILSNAQAAQRLLASNGGGSSEVRDILEDIVREDKHAGEVIRRLRQFLKKEEGENLEMIDMRDVIEDGLRLVRTDLLDRGVALERSFSPVLAPVRADRVQIQQVLVNLVTNACDSMAETARGERRLVVRADPSEGPSVRVSLSDRGRGIPAEDLDRIFEPFVSMKNQGMGMGMGLALCRSIISAHGGRLWATNNADRGATFLFTIPTNGGAA